MSASGGPGKAGIVLSGYYGFQNLGDEAVLAGLVQALRQTSGGNAERLRITALSADPAATQRDHGPEMDAVDRNRVGSVVRAIASSDLLASGGGSLPQDVTSAHSIFYYLGIVKLAQLMGKKTMFIAQGIGPLKLARSRKLTAAVASRCNAITVRDTASAELLQQIGVTRVKPLVTADPALLLGHPAAHTGRNAIALSLRNWQAAGSKLAWQIAHALPAGVTTLNSLQMSVSDAALHADAIQAARAILPDVVVEQSALTQIGRPLLDGLIGYAASAEMVIGMRLHALILAAACGVPAVALSYDPKINAFMRESGQDDAVFDVRDHSADALAGLVGRIWSTREQRAGLLRDRLPSLRQAALRNADVALDLMK